MYHQGARTKRETKTERFRENVPAMAAAHADLPGCKGGAKVPSGERASDLRVVGAEKTASEPAVTGGDPSFTVK